MTMAHAPLASLVASPAATAAPWALLHGLGHSLALEPGQVLARQGSPGDSLFLLEHGRLAVVRRVPGDEHETVDTVGPGAMLGEIAVLDQGVRSASLRALEASRVQVIGQRQFELQALERGTDGVALLRALLASIEQRLATARRLLAGRMPLAPAAVAQLDASALPRRPLAVAESARLATLAPFDALAPAERAALAHSACVVELERGAGLWLPADSGMVWLLLRGALALQGPAGLPVIAPGHCLDPHALLPEAGMTAEAAPAWRARSPSRLLALPLELALQPPLLLALARQRARLLRRTTGLLMHATMSWQ